MHAPCPCARDKDACKLSHGGKAEQSVSLWQLSVTSGGCRCKNPDLPLCQRASQSQSCFQICERKCKHTRKDREKRENPSFRRAEGPMRCSYLLSSRKTNSSNILKTIIYTINNTKNEQAKKKKSL